MKKTLIILSLFFAAYQTILSQSPYTNVLIDNTQGSGFYPNEPSICMNPKNTNQVVGGAIINKFYYSTNGGLNWTIGSLLSLRYGVWGDPIISVDTSGTFYYSHLSNPPSYGSWIDRIVFQKSTNAGMSWSSHGTYVGLNPPKDQDKQGVVVDWTHGPRGNWIYVTWTQFDAYNSVNPTDSSHILFSRSTDAGLTWSTALRINKQGGDCIDEDYTVEGATPAVGPNGELYVAWSGPQSNNNFKIFFDRSTDGGNTWLANDIIAGTQRGGWDYVIGGINRSNGLPCTLCDISTGPYRGTIYVNYTDSAGPNDHDVMLIKSSDGGNTWSSPIRINNDPAGKEQFTCWMSIDQLYGHLYCVFYDRRNYTNTSTDVFIARSTNGGTTWTNERISESPFSPTSGPFFGDYISITSHNGKVRPIWSRLVGTTSVWTAIIDYPVGVAHSGNEIPKIFSLEQNYPNPFNPTTNIEFRISNFEFVTLKIFDVLGREIETLVNEQLKPGTYQKIWNAAEFASGVYFYTLQAGSFKETKKMILSK